MTQMMEWLGGYLWLAAFVLGAAHALQPGHGKTIVAAYLIGSRGTVKDACLLGVVVTFTHTITIFILAILAKSGAFFLDLERLEKWLGMAASLLIIAVGGVLIVQLLRQTKRTAQGQGSRRLHQHGHERREHGHTHPGGAAHSHPVGRGADGTNADPEHTHFPGVRHSHRPPEGDASLSQVFLLGVSGGIVPCPEGLAIFLASVAGGRLETGLLLVVVFSLGLAATLVLIGILFLRASSLLNNSARSRLWSQRIRWFSAVLITGVGLVYFVRYLWGLA